MGIQNEYNLKMIKKISCLLTLLIIAGCSTESDFEISYGNDNTSKILGFSLTGATIPVGSATLVQLSFTSFEDEICIPYTSDLS